MPANTSSRTTPTPPESRRSIRRIGYGLNISKALNSIKPITTDLRLNGRPIRATIMPAISSITILPGSLFCKIFSARCAVQMAKTINPMMQSEANKKLILERTKQSGIPNKEPNVPGAKGMFPTKQPVARNMAAFSLKCIARVYNLELYLSSCKILTKPAQSCYRDIGILRYFFRHT